MKIIQTQKPYGVPAQVRLRCGKLSTLFPEQINHLTASFLRYEMNVIMSQQAAEN